MAAADYYPITQLVYIAYFGRPADPAGMRAFAAALDDLHASTTIAALAAQVDQPGAAGLRSLIGSFGVSNESRTLYSARTTQEFVTSVFDNIFHREPAAGGLAYWTAEIDSGRVGMAEAALKIMAGAYANTTNPQQAALDRLTVDNKLAAAGYFTEQLDASGLGHRYAGQDAAWQARYLLSQVDTVAAPVPFRDTVDSVVRQVTGREPSTAPVLLSNSADYSGSDAAERVLVGRSSGDVATGGGDDTVFLKSATLAPGGSLDGGAGTDTLVISGEHAAAASLDGTLASGATVALDGGANGFTVNVKNAATGTADVLTLSTTAAKDLSLGYVTVPHVETIRLHTQDVPQAATDSGTSLRLYASAATSIVATGNAGLTLAFDATALRSFDASGQSGPVWFQLNYQLDGALSARGGTGDNHMDFDDATKGVSYQGRAGRDTVVGGPGDNVIATGAGADFVSLYTPLAGARNNVSLGDGNDIFYTADSGATVVSGGRGVDEFHVFRAGRESASQFLTITDFERSERIDFYEPNRKAQPTLGAAVDAGANASFQQYLDAAAAGSSGALRWFVHGADTYVVLDNSSLPTFLNGSDQVVKLSGVLDLSGAMFTGGILYGTAF